MTSSPTRKHYIMKLRNSITLLLLTALTVTAALCSCVDDYFADKGRTGLAPGTPVELTLGVSMPATGTSVSASSRANPNTELNRQIYDLYLMFFDEEPGSDTYGKLKTKFYFSSIDASTETQCDPEYSTNGSALIVRTGLGTGKIRHIHTTAGRTKIVGLANISTKGSSNIISSLGNVTTYADLEAIMVSTIGQNGQPDFESELSLMSGFYCDNDETHTAEHSTLCSVLHDNERGNVDINSEHLPGTVWLTPLQAKVNFIIDGNGSRGGTFELQSWQVYNLPGQTPLFCKGYPESNSPAEDGADDFTPVDTKPLTAPLITTIYPYSNTDGYFGEDKLDVENLFAFSFFPADNHPGRAKHPITSYEQRAAWEGSNGTQAVAPDKKTFTNAPDGATYVVLRGRYRGQSYVTESFGGKPVEKYVDADVSYTVFLGHNSGNNGENHDYEDFNTHRNINYTYIVRIKGVNDISVEVNAADERRPDAEGNISILDTSTETLDCHFEQRVVSFSREQIRQAIKDHNFRMIVDEPVFAINRANYRYFLVDKQGEYMLDNLGNRIVGEDNESANAIKYMQWVQFYRHTDDEIGRSYIPYTDAKRKDKLMNVKEFMAHLVDFANEAPGDTTAFFTVYFDEYVYLDEHGNQVHPVTGESVPWKRLVSNTGVRTFSMMGSTRFSADHNSSYSTTGTSFQQRQMQTIYNPNAAGLERAWATECIEEKIYPDIPADANGSGGIPYTYYNSAADPERGATIYGRQNCWRTITNGDTLRRRTIDYLFDPMTGYMKHSENVCRYIECMSRNRDLNGNGVIDREEFRWYMPSIEQLHLLYIGREGLAPEVQLYNPDIERKYFFVHSNGKLTYPLKHYISSSRRKLWSEEGSSDGTVNFNNNSPGNRLPMLYMRCVRDLGTDAVRDPGIPWNISTSSASADARFQSIYEVIDGEAAGNRQHVMCRIRLSYINNGATRNIAEKRERPGIVTTFTDSNKPVYEFEVADTLLTGVNFKDELPNAEASPQRSTRCQELGNGWRMPTFAELIIMQWAGKLAPSGNMGSRTRSHYNYHQVQQGEFYKFSGWLHFYAGGKFTVLDDKKSSDYIGNVRCVRDYMRDDELNNDSNDENTDNASSSGKPARRVRRMRR